MIFHHLIFEKYTFHDVKTRREFTIYVQIILYHIKSTNINNVKNQLTFIYQNIIAKLRAFVNSSSFITIITFFIQILKLKKNT